MIIQLPIAVGFNSNLGNYMGYTILRLDGSTYQERTTADIVEVNNTYSAAIDVPLNDLPLIVRWNDSSSSDESFGRLNDDTTAKVDQPPIPSNLNNYSGWKQVVILVIRNLVGDIDQYEYEYSNERILQIFMVSTILVKMEVLFPIDYTINIPNQEIDPEPIDNDFIGLCCLRAACVLLNSEMRSKSGIGKVSVKDGPSTITMDTSDLISAIKDTGRSVCDKYDLAVFAYKVGQQVGVAILGPNSPDSFGIKTHYEQHREQY